MRNLTTFVATLFAGACFSFAQAQNPGDDMTDRLMNPSFEEDHQSLTSTGGRIFVPNGWTFERESAGWDDFRVVASGDVASDGKNSYFDSYDGNRHVSYWGEKITSLDLYQEVSDLPAGGYQLSAMVRLVTHQSDLTKEEKVTDQHLYAKVMEGDSAVSSIMPLSAVGDEPENWTKLTVLFNVAEEGQVIRLGMASTNNGLNDAGGFQIDNYQLMYLGNGDAFIIQIKAAINDYLSRSEALMSNETPLASGELASLQTICDVTQELGGNTDSATLENAYFALRDVYTEALETHDLQKSLMDAIIEASGNLRPDETGKAAFEEASTTAIEIVNSYVDYPVYKKDVEQAIVDFALAYKLYQMTELEGATAANPKDATWTISYPNFENAEGSLAGDGWVTDNNPAVFDQYKLHTVNGRHCWNNWNSNFTRMDVYQELTNLPTGKYAISCETTTNSIPNDQHAYVMSTAGTAVSPAAQYYYEGTDKFEEAPVEWEVLTTEQVFVGNDGKLRLGMRSTCGGNDSGWFCMAGFKLTYYGVTDSDYTEALDTRLAQVNAYQDSTMMKGDKAILSEILTTASATDKSNLEAIDAAFESLNEGEAIATKSMSAYNSYMKGEYAVSLNYLEADNETVTSATSKAFLQSILTTQGEIVNADTTHYAIMAIVLDQLDAYNNYIIPYDVLQNYIEIDIALAKSLIESHNMINADATKAVIDSLTADLKMLVAPLQAYDAQVESAQNYLMEGGYTSEGVEAMLSTLAEQMTALESATDLAAIEKATTAVKEAIRMLQLAKEGTGPLDITAWIENPEITQTKGNVKNQPAGWENSWNTGTNGNFTKYASGDTYLEAWQSKATAISFDYNQTIGTLPAGYYRLQADVRTSQGIAEGNVVLYAISNKGEYQTPVYNVDYLAGMTEESSISDEFYAATVDSIAVTWEGIQFGIKTIDAIGTCWTAADNFQLYYLGEGGLSGIEDTYVSDSAEELEIAIVDKRIRVLNAENYRINDVNGLSYPLDTEIKAGTLYIISAPGKKSRSIMLVQ